MSCEQICLNLTLKLELSRISYPPKYSKLPDIIIHALKTKSQNDFITKKVWTANLAFVCLCFNALR